jgi:hypothetical protein
MMTAEKQSQLKTILLAVITTIVGSLTTATLDWATAKMVSYDITVPMVTPVGTVNQIFQVEETIGSISGYQWEQKVWPK